MPAKDIFHDIVVTALQKEGWQITDDPLRLKFGVLTIQKSNLRLLVFDDEKKEIIKWIN